jgi:HSP20 family molecular chaperone IbpA
MATIAVEKVTGSGQSPPPIKQLETLADRIRHRAYEIFQNRGTNGREFDDWLQAEHDLIFAPESELVEKDGKYEIRVAAPGFKAAETNVTALPDAVIVSAESSHKHEENKEDVHFCEFGTRTLFRRLDLPTPINVDKVTANLDDGMLRIVAQKSENALHAESAAA